VTKLGIEPLSAFEYTPYEINLMAENYLFKSKEKLKGDITLAYYTEYFARHKKLPKLEKVLKNVDKPAKTESKGDIILKQMAKSKGIIIRN